VPGCAAECAPDTGVAGGPDAAGVWARGGLTVDGDGVVDSTVLSAVSSGAVSTGSGAIASGATPSEANGSAGIVMTPTPANPLEDMEDSGSKTGDSR